MDLFISWSGDKSRKLGEVLNKYIPMMIQKIKPYYTPRGIDKGQIWQTSILDKLNNCTIGIICLTSDNLNKPWIMFEAGALSNKSKETKVCPLVFGIPKSSVVGPLTVFQISEFNEDDFKELINSINRHLGNDRIDEIVLDASFEAFFPKIKSEVEAILSENVDSEIDNVIRTERELLEEIVENTRNLLNDGLRNTQHNIINRLNDKLNDMDENDSSDYIRPKYKSWINENLYKTMINNMKNTQNDNPDPKDLTGYDK